MTTAIIGAGPGGLVAARILAQAGHPVAVFEREASARARSQGGSLDLHAGSGQLALARAGLTTEFRRIARYQDQETHLYDHLGALHFADRNTTGKNRPETDRGHLRAMLVGSLAPGVIRWDRRVVGVAPAGAGWAVGLADGTSEVFDLVVGADGTWSRVRPLLSEVAPRYTGITMVEFGIDDVDRRYPALAAKAGRGLTFAVGGGKALIAHRDADAHLGCYAGLRVDAGWFEREGLGAMPAGAARERLGAEYAGWSPELLDWILRSEGPLVPRAIHELPPGHRWTPRPGLTLIGDAAHVMSPFGGDGANLAMLDGAELAQALLQPDWRGAVAAFEERMWARAGDASAEASEAIQQVFAPGGLGHIVAMMRQHSAAAPV